MDKVIESLISERNFKQKPIIIGFTGHIGVGKNYMAFQLANRLIDNGYSVAFDALANPLKKLIQYYAYKLKSIKPKSNDFVYITREDIIKTFMEAPAIPDFVQRLIQDKEDSDWRTLAQTVGEEVRKAFGQDVWVELLISRILGMNTDFVIVTDVRYPNEERMLRHQFPDTFVLIKVTRDIRNICKSLGISKEEYEKMLKHESEAMIDQLTYDFEIKNPG